MTEKITFNQTVKNEYDKLKQLLIELEFYQYDKEQAEQIKLQIKELLAQM